MPELPEVETVRLGLAPVLENHRLVRVLARRKDLRIPFPPRFAERLTGRTVLSLRRRAKYLLGYMDNGEVLVMHLGMSGRFTIYKGDSTEPIGAFKFNGPKSEHGFGKHDHVIFETDAPARIIFSDHRRFGLMTIISAKDLEGHPLFRKMGVEPLAKEFNLEFLISKLAGKRTPMKAALLDQNLIAGLGNIYVCEALHRARISPKRLAGSVKKERLALLVTAIKKVLHEAIEAGGSTLRDYAQADGSLGYFQHRFSAYDREGKPCTHRGCKGHIKRIIQSGRSTFYCTTCQR